MDELINKVAENLTKLENWRDEFIEARAKEEREAKIKQRCSFDEEFDIAKPLTWGKLFARNAMELGAELTTAKLTGAKSGMAKKACDGKNELKSSSCSFAINKLGDAPLKGASKLCEWLDTKKK
ncbi:unnamed protein product [Meloidogyne enterolobii]|uniref:Uncharacterized protein n=1 Tax=Meloidogyne enterolobii TaxID=390850 RepID=A0ACB0YDU3_MELEN